MREEEVASEWTRINLKKKRKNTSYTNQSVSFSSLPVKQLMLNIDSHLGPRTCVRSTIKIYLARILKYHRNSHSNSFRSQTEISSIHPFQNFATPIINHLKEENDFSLVAFRHTVQKDSCDLTRQKVCKSLKRLIMEIFETLA